MGASFFVPLALSALSTGAQYENQQQANSAAQNVEAQNIEQQNALRNQAGAQVNQLAHQIGQDNPATIAGQEEGNYINELRKNQAGAQTGGATGATQTFGMPVSALPTAGNFGNRYNSDVAAAQNQVQQYGNTYANELANIDAATRLRQNEGLGMENVGTNINLLNTQAWGQNFVNQLRAQQAAQANPYVALGAAILGQGASGLSKNGLPVSTSTQLGQDASNYGDAGANILAQQAAAGFPGTIYQTTPLY